MTAQDLETMNNNGCRRKHGGTSGDGSKNVYYTRIIGRKRVLPKTPEKLPVKKICCSSSEELFQRPLIRTPPRPKSSSQLSRLPEDLLVNIISRANHGDLKHFLLVSKSVRDAVKISKEVHFDLKTPRPGLRGFHHIGSEKAQNLADEEEQEAPKAPRRLSRTRACGKSLADITIALFPDDDAEY
ncbi:F-box protein At1g61340-like [Wolffia australiana]